MGNKIIGIDQGLKTVATLSDGQTTPDTDCHGHSLQSVIKKLSRKKKVQRVSEKLKLIGECKDGLLMLDKELSLRVFVDSTLPAGPAQP